MGCPCRGGSGLDLWRRDPPSGAAIGFPVLQEPPSLALRYPGPDFPASWGFLGRALGRNGTCGAIPRALAPRTAPSSPPRPPQPAGKCATPIRGDLPEYEAGGGADSSPPRWTATTAEEMRGRRPASSEISVAHASIRKGTRKTRAERAGSPNGRIAPLGLILCCGLARRTITVPAWPAPTLPINDTGWTARRRA